ncbi:MAG: hypothetical protein J7577_22985 [Sphingobacteriaceae bacterium]|nr:hypothetical protein [Sphingobacteriaceae bacterium]
MKEVISTIIIVTLMVSASSCRQNDDEPLSAENVKSLKAVEFKEQMLSRTDSIPSVANLGVSNVKPKDPPPKDGGQWKPTR